ncbi:MAG: acyl-CoA dehydrogenase family protein [Hydrogenophaga sp.]|uniref:acyl-CoA dehydrogenase family protein n=1 Tax=Hydrogenophaga sp. TaxID=1904254 RepID=UPI002727B519|nr:acyl-CoA dehydrogenase family protein [Hydrogenophaga sp.]MDO9147776.1 acyl-CoA dehydrogenase family protein [Hydrogenophaga sp.]MDO9603912.1 acyl-CoA dehydrogenase family protein [Hydrogenophaga sp.]MDP2164041.1 acyl-CoA dehydrogenase family protein [Hydrogenophaga sp.]MDP3474486.1 acyl-CoA dehydrogenase family protein [Hydrogenophaga sp.]
MVAFEHPHPHGLVPSTAHLELPFFDAHHRQMAPELVAWSAQQQVDETDDRAACRDWVQRLAGGGWLRYCVPAAHGGALPALDSRSLVILRETLAFHSPLADFAFAMQGLGSGAITLAGTPAQQAAYLPAVAAGRKIAAFALSEPDAGSDVAAMATQAVPVAAGYRLNGSKTWISNGDLADFYVVFAKTEPHAGARGISAFIVDARHPGLDSHEHIHVMAPHPLATLRFNDCTLPAEALVGPLHGGFKLAMQTLDIFRASVAAAALGMARRAFAEAVAHAKRRQMFGQTLADFQLTQARLGEMSALIEAAALLTYRAAWQRDCSHTRGAGTPAYTAAAASAKLTATENAQRVIDMALQMFGGRGVQVGQKIESLYRDIRSLRIYEGASEVQLLILGKAALR